MIDYRPNSELADVDVKGMTVKLTFDSVKGDVLNVVPPHRAGDIAQNDRAHHRQPALVRRGLADHGVGRGEGRARARRRDAVGAGDAQVGEHGEPARQGVRGGGDRAASRASRSTRSR